MPDAINHTSGWGTSNFYFYEIINDIGERIRIQFTLSSRNIPDNLRKICDRINDFYPAKMKKVNWQWRIPFSTDFYRIRDKNSNDEYDKDIIYKELNKMLEKMEEFERDLEKKWGIA